MDYYIGMLATFGFTWTPVDFANCNGQQVSIQQYTALYALIGATYGGDHRTYFNVPNLNGRTLVHQGTSPASGHYYPLGESSGAPMAQLGISNLPPHTHTATLSGSGSPVTVQVSTAGATHETPVAGDFFASTNLGGDPVSAYIGSGSAGTTVALGGVSGGGVTGATVTNGLAGAGQSFSIMNPFLVMNVCICVNGLFPPRP